MSDPFYFIIMIDNTVHSVETSFFSLFGDFQKDESEVHQTTTASPGARVRSCSRSCCTWTPHSASVPARRKNGPGGDLVDATRSLGKAKSLIFMHLWEYSRLNICHKVEYVEEYQGVDHGAWTMGIFHDHGF